jgi:antitoxin HicB
LQYPIHIQLDTNGQYLVTFLDIPEAATTADTEGKALVMAVDALESALDFYFDDKRLVPPPSRVKRGQHFVDLPATVAAKAMVHNEMLAKGIKKAKLARRMNMAAPNVERIFHAKHGTKFETLKAAFAALGKKSRLMFDKRVIPSTENCL